MNRPATKLPVFAFLAAALVLSALVAHPATVSAQASTTAIKHPVPADVKGTLGVGLIGAELGFVLPAVAGLNQTWAFIVFPIVGAAGGAAAGYFGLEKGNHTQLAVASLTLGMALLIPALVVTISETAYDPEDDKSDTGAARARRLQLAARARDPRSAGTGMVRLSPEGIALATPAVDVLGVLPGTSGRGAQLRVSGVSGVELSLLSGRF